MLYLVTEDLDLAHSPVHQLAAATATVVGVDLQVQGDPLHPLLRGEVCAQAVHPNEHLQTGTGLLWGLGTSSGSTGGRGQGQKQQPGRGAGHFPPKTLPPHLFQLFNSASPLPKSCLGMFLLIFLIFHLKGTLRQQSPAGREEGRAAASGIAQQSCLNKYSSHTGLFYHQEGVNCSGSSGRKAEHSSNPNCISKLPIHCCDLGIPLDPGDRFAAGEAPRAPPAEDFSPETSSQFLGKKTSALGVKFNWKERSNRCHGHTNTQTPKHPNTQTPKHLSPPVPSP